MLPEQLAQKLQDILDEVYNIGCETEYDYQQKYSVVKMLEDLIAEVKDV